jgi:hypothetical protein
MHVRVCPECEEEYRSDIAVCADCGTELQDRTLGEKGEVIEPPDPVEAEPGVPARALFAGDSGPLRTMADVLVGAGIPFRLVPKDRTAFSRYEQAQLVLAVPEPEAQRALSVLEGYKGRGTELGFAELATTFGGADDAEAPPCPACEAHVPLDASECPECGLELGAHEGAELEDPDER